MRRYESDGMRGFHVFLRMDYFSTTIAYGIFLSAADRSDLVQIEEFHGITFILSGGFPSRRFLRLSLFTDRRLSSYSAHTATN